jgi:hypothetical protein
VANADFVLYDGVSTETIVVADSTPMTQRAVDTTTALNTHSSTGHFRCSWGYGITASFNDAIEFAANLNGTATNVQAFIPAANYPTGAALAGAMTVAMQAAEDLFSGGPRVTITVTYDEGTGLFNWAWVQLRATVSQFIIRGNPSSPAGAYGRTILTSVGMQLGSDQVGTGASGNVNTDNDTRVNRFCFGYTGAAGSIRLADAAFTAEDFYGITDVTNQTIGHYLCTTAMTDPVPAPVTVPAPTFPAPAPASVGTSSQLRVLIPKYFDQHDWAWWNREMHWSGSTDFDMTVLRGNLKERMLAFSEGERGTDLPARPGPTKGPRGTG